MELRQNIAPYRIYGEPLIDEATKNQLFNGLRLKPAVAGALMPDAHLGYGLPIGGVLALDNAVSPNAVGVDIACRMAMSVYPINPDVIEREHRHFCEALMTHTKFGLGAHFDPQKEKLNQSYLFETADDLRHWESAAKACGKDPDEFIATAHRQLGSSGGGNHFVDIGVYIGPNGRPHLAIMSHSGSRGAGARIAEAFRKIAEVNCRLEPPYRDLSYLYLTDYAGADYWYLMNLMGQYASENHHAIHRRLAEVLDLGQPHHFFENHHNFAWKEMYEDERGWRSEVIVHRKGATPVPAGEYGIIPSTAIDTSYVVVGTGEPGSLNSMSHGAGRLYSRKKAKQMFTREDVDATFAKAGVTMLGGGLDEAPQAYKTLDEVLGYQSDLFEIHAIFQPKIVRMSPGSFKPWEKQ